MPGRALSWSLTKEFVMMSNYSIFAKIKNETEANIIGSSLERMDPYPIGIGVLEIEDGSGFWELSAFFSEKPNDLELKILEVVHQIDFVVSKVVTNDWVSQVQRDLHPVRAGRFILFGSHDRDKVSMNAYGLEIEASMAFGTGHHATTVGCLLALEYLIKKGWFFRNIADIGCGTGVLAMAAAKVCKSNAVACDIDEVAVATAKSNFRANGLSAKISLFNSNGFKNFEIKKRSCYDLIFANILATPLCKLVPGFLQCTRKKGFIILSGILDRQVNRVERYYVSNGFRRVWVNSIDQWTTIIMRRS